MPDTSSDERKAAKTSNGSGLSNINKGLVLLCGLLTTLVGVYTYRDSVLRSETEISNKIIDDLNSLTTTDPRAADKLAVLRIRISERGCEKHDLLAKLGSDFATRMKTLCFENDLATKIAQNFERSLATLGQQSSMAPKIPQKNPAPSLPPPERTVTPRSNSPYVLDIFWCESVDNAASENATNQQFAKAAYSVISSSSLVSRVRVRKLPTTRLPIDNYFFYYGRGVQAIMLPEDTAILNVIKEKLAVRGIPLTLQPATGLPDTYLSIFVCYNARTLRAEDFAGTTTPAS